MKLDLVHERWEHGKMRLQLGTAGHLGLFAWSLLMVTLAPGGRLLWIKALPLVVLLAVYPGVWRGVLTGRRLTLLGLIALPTLFFVGEAKGPGISAAGLQACLGVSVRFVVVMAAVEGMTRSVELAALAGVLERLGLQGLGFSVGVALNLVPCLQISCTRSWRTLRMRGGLRRKWWRGLRLFALTAASSALMRAEEIALAAEARGFRPEKARAAGIERSALDWFLLPLAGLSLAVAAVV